MTRPFWATKCALIELADGGGAEPHEARVLVVVDLRHGREQLGVEDDADLAADVVEHAVGVDGAVALAEDDVAFHVDFERHVAGLRHAAWAAADVDRPRSTTRSVSMSTSPSGPNACGQAVDRETLDDDVHAAADDDRVLVRAGLVILKSEVAATAWEDLDAAEAGSVRLCWRWCRHRLRNLERRA